jgi:ElaB/YqjD/DUF883 family membrane-anchored ribosome-binding protein
MAKRGRRKKHSTALVTTAEHVGSALGHVAARVDLWKKQRAEIAADLQKLMANARGLMNDLGHTADVRGARALKAASKAVKAGPRKGFKMSEQTKRKLRAAWKRRRAAKA